MGAIQATAGDKKAEEQDIVKLIDADLKRIDKELFGWITPDKKR